MKPGQVVEQDGRRMTVLAVTGPRTAYVTNHRVSKYAAAEVTFTDDAKVYQPAVPFAQYVGTVKEVSA